MKRLLLVLSLILVTGLPGLVRAECGLDVSGLHVTNNLYIEGRINNTGSQNESITYHFFVGGKPAGNGSITLDSHETMILEREYPFGVGDYDIELDAVADCGERDSETMRHIVKQPFECSGPYGLPGQNICDYSRQQYLACDGGEWNVIAEGGGDYCFNCPGTCGDGVCNCGEGEECPDCTCKEGYLDGYRCHGGDSEREYQHGDCGREWRHWEDCSYGCSNGACNPPGGGTYCDCTGREYILDGASQGIGNLAFYQNCRSVCGLECFYQSDCGTGYGCSGFECVPDFEVVCGVYVFSLDYSNNVVEGQGGFVTAGIRNTGEWNERINISFYLSGTLIDSSHHNVSEDGEIMRTVYFSRPPGTYQVKVNATAGCGSGDVRYAALTVLGEGAGPGPICDNDGVCDPGENNLNCPGDCPAFMTPLETGVSFRPGELDMALERGEVISIDIESSTSQVFRISVTGVPEDWVEYSPALEVSGIGTAFVYVRPASLGTYNLSVIVLAEGEGLEFGASIPLYVAVPREGITDWLFNGLRGAWSYLTGSSAALGITIAVLLILVLSLAAWKLREDRD